MKTKVMKRPTVAKVMGQALRKERRSANIVQTKLSRELGISQSTLSKIESGFLMLGLLEFQRAVRIFPNLKGLPEKLA